MRKQKHERRDYSKPEPGPEDHALRPVRLRNQGPYKPRSECGRTTYDDLARTVQEIYPDPDQLTVVTDYNNRVLPASVLSFGSA